jgi:sugar phosphate isomerase/epimerase
MEIGFYTIHGFAEDWDCEQLFKWASGHDFKAIEVLTSPKSMFFPSEKVIRGDVSEIKSMIKKYNVTVSALVDGYMCTHYLSNNLEERGKAIEYLKRVIDACAKLDVRVVNTQIFPSVYATSREETRKKNLELLSEVFPSAVDYAKEHGVKIALENWDYTLMYNPPTWDMVFEIIPDKTLGLNFDPSHLVWQQIDYLEVARKFGEHIYHVHAKDTEIIRSRLSYRGLLESHPFMMNPPSTHWWRFRIPGWGQIDWRAFISVLKEIGYNYVLSIEYEDKFFSPEEGVIRAHEYLSKLI